MQLRDKVAIISGAAGELDCPNPVVAVALARAYNDWLYQTYDGVDRYCPDRDLIIRLHEQTEALGTQMSASETSRRSCDPSVLRAHDASK